MTNPWGEIVDIEATYYRRGDSPIVDLETTLLDHGMHPVDPMGETNEPGWWISEHDLWWLDAPVDDPQNAVDDLERLICDAICFRLMPLEYGARAAEDDGSYFTGAIYTEGVTMFEEWIGDLKTIADWLRHTPSIADDPGNVVSFQTLWSLRQEPSTWENADEEVDIDLVGVLVTTATGITVYAAGDLPCR